LNLKSSGWKDYRAGVAEAKLLISSFLKVEPKSRGYFFVVWEERASLAKFKRDFTASLCSKVLGDLAKEFIPLMVWAGRFI
jgi:hypothetical protein